MILLWDFIMTKSGKIILGVISSIVVIGLFGGSHANTNNSKQELTPVNQTQQKIVLPAKEVAPTVAATTIAQPTIKKATPTLKPTSAPTLTPTPKPTIQPQVKSTSSDLSNDNHYTNSAGETVHSPAKTQDNSVPAGASAICGDGSYSFSQSRRGTCSHHGGVSQWL
jgi:hypothetical protein